MKAGQTLSEVTSEAMKVRRYHTKEVPDMVLVHGDSDNLFWSISCIL